MGVAVESVMEAVPKQRLIFLSSVMRKFVEFAVRDPEGALGASPSEALKYPTN
jgi:hypothetical protein